jgi:hypothetical protein
VQFARDEIEAAAAETLGEGVDGIEQAAPEQGHEAAPQHEHAAPEPSPKSDQPVT